MKETENTKTKQVLAIEKRLKPKKVFFVKSKCCGDTWFMDYNFPEKEGAYTSWRITHNIKTKKLKIVTLRTIGSSVNFLSFNTTRSLFSYFNQHLKP